MPGRSVVVAGAIVCAAVLRLLLIEGIKRVVTIAPNVRAVRLRVSNPAGSYGGAIELESSPNPEWRQSIGGDGERPGDVALRARGVPSVSILSRFALLTTCVLLAACGGGGGGSSGGSGGGGGNVRPDLPLPVPNAEMVRIFTNSAAPAETGAEQYRRGEAIVSRADSLFLTDVHVVTSSSAVPPRTVRSDCTGGSCVLLGQTIRSTDLALAGAPSPVLTKNGVTLVQYSDPDLRSYGAWMDHAGFAIQSEAYVQSGITHVPGYGIAGGDRTGAAPGATSLSWSGLMVGATRTSSGHVLQGDAALSWDGSDLDATFSSIRNLDLRRVHTTPSVTFTGMTVDAQGTFSDGSRGGDRIQGSFYGPSHAEVAGIVETADLA